MGPAAIAAMPSLIAAYDRVLTSEQHRIGQSAIARAIGQIAPNTKSAPEAVAILTRALDSDDWSVRDAAARAIGNFGQDGAVARPTSRPRMRSRQKRPRSRHRPLPRRSNHHPQPGTMTPRTGADQSGMMAYSRLPLRMTRVARALRVYVGAASGRKGPGAGGPGRRRSGCRPPVRSRAGGASPAD